MTRDKKPYYRWYPGDLRRDAAVQSCSWDIRAVWREMLDLMHDGEPRGYLTAGGVPLRTGRELAIAIGGGIPVRLCQAAIDMVRAKRICGVTDDGVIFSRRMVRDEALDQVRAEGGSKGGRKGSAKGGGEVPPPPSFPPHPPNNPLPCIGNGTGTARDAFGGKVLRVPKFLDEDFVRQLNGQAFDLTGFYLALDQRLAQTGEPWDLRWIRDQFAAESPRPERRQAERFDKPFTADERQKAERVRRNVWGNRCRHDPTCETAAGCIAAIITGWRQEAEHVA